jgi:hypothetical protein
MLGEKIGEETGKVTIQRALASAGGGPKMETTFQANGSILGVGHKTTGTYTSEMRPDGNLYGEGEGIVMNSERGGATWVGSGVGTIKKVVHQLATVARQVAQFADGRRRNEATAFNLGFHGISF